MRRRNATTENGVSAAGSSVSSRFSSYTCEIPIVSFVTPDGSVHVSSTVRRTIASTAFAGQPRTASTCSRPA